MLLYLDKIEFVHVIPMRFLETNCTMQKNYFKGSHLHFALCQYKTTQPLFCLLFGQKARINNF